MGYGWGVGLFGAAALAGGVAMSTMRDRAVPAPAVTTAPVYGDRISFPENRLPSLSMPGGGMRRVRSILNTPDAMHYGEYRWNDADVPDGPVWIRIDLAQQTMSVFRAGHEIGTAVILYGTDGKPTPTGTFPIMAMATQHRSSLYDAEMPFMLRLTGDGVAIHASAVRQGSATHGCIGVPEAFAKRLFGVVHRGDPVSILPATPVPTQQRT